MNVDIYNYTFDYGSNALNQSQIKLQPYSWLISGMSYIMSIDEYMILENIQTLIREFESLEEGVM